MERRDEILGIIRQRIQELGLRQRQIANYLGITQGNLSQRLAGKIRFTLDELAQLLPLLDLPPLLSVEQETLGTVPEIALLAHALSELSAKDRQELFLFMAIILEGKLQEPMRSQICSSLRFLANPPVQDVSYSRKYRRMLRRVRKVILKPE
jgi:transcriptional regulator with XRE-family HTH domain